MTDSNQEPRARVAQRWLEVFGVFVVLAIFAGGEPSATDESHYLAKSKHYWDPSWCPTDFFLNSADAHAVFYWTFGWLTKFFSLPAAAWIARVAIWIFQAIGWQRFSTAVAPQRWLSLLSIAVFLAFMKNFHMAREWAIGDAEAKCVAWGFVFFGLAALVRNRWNWVWSLFGAAAAFHVIVGGWAVVAAMMAWGILKLANRAEANRPPSVVSMIPSLALGFALSLPGLLPVLLLNRGTPPEIVDEGNIAYVYARLSHHLVFHRFNPLFIGRHAALVVIAALLAWRNWQVIQLRPLFAIAGGALVLSVIGVALDYASFQMSDGLSASLLRFYWYRLADMLVPIAVTMTLTYRVASDYEKPMAKVLLVGMLLFAGLNLAMIQFRRMELGVPESQRTLMRNEPNRAARRAVHRDWLACCASIQAASPPDAIFLTPSEQQTFKWYSSRGEVITWKDAPQDAAGMSEWLRRLQDVRQPERVILHPPETDPTLPYEERLVALGKRYGADYVVIDLRRDPIPKKLIRVYPRGEELNLTFAVYRLKND